MSIVWHDLLMTLVIVGVLGNFALFFLGAFVVLTQNGRKS